MCLVGGLDRQNKIFTGIRCLTWAKSIAGLVLGNTDSLIHSFIQNIFIECILGVRHVPDISDWLMERTVMGPVLLVDYG